MAEEEQGYNMEIIERKDKETNETSLSIISHFDVFNRLELLSDSDLKMILLAKKGCDTNLDNPYRLNDNCYHLGDNIFELRHVQHLSRGQIGKALSRTPNAVLIYSNVTNTERNGNGYDSFSSICDKWVVPKNAYIS